MRDLALNQLRVREISLLSEMASRKIESLFLFLFDLEKAVKIQLAFCLAVHPQLYHHNVKVSVFYYYQKLLNYLFLAILSFQHK